MLEKYVTRTKSILLKEYGLYDTFLIFFEYFHDHTKCIFLPSKRSISLIPNRYLFQFQHVMDSYLRKLDKQLQLLYNLRSFLTSCILGLMSRKLC